MLCYCHIYMAQQSNQPASLSEVPLTSEELERAGLIDFATDRDFEVPVGTQLVWKLRAMIARRALRPGDRLPSVRELAQFAGVNVNTARAAYLALEGEGAIASEHGRGTYVADGESTPGAMDELVQEALRRARERGIDPIELATTIWAAAGAENQGVLPQPPLPDLDPKVGDATLRRELRRQIGRLEAELAAYAWQDRKTPAPRRVETAKPVGRLTSVDELQHTRDALIDQLSRLRGEAEGRGIREARARARMEGMLDDPAAHRWEVVTSADIGEPSCANWRIVPRYGPLGAILGWWRVKVSSGCPLAEPLAAVSENAARS